MKTRPSTTGRLVFLFALALSAGISDRPPTLAEDPPGAGDAPGAKFPEITLLTQDGKEVRFYEDLVKGKIVLFHVMYTRCDGNCAEGIRDLLKLQKALEDRRGKKEVFMYSITLDPEHDTPAVLKEYAESWGVKPGWTFLTAQGERASDDLARVRGSVGMRKKDPNADADRKNHSGKIRIYNEPLKKWATASIQDSTNRIVQMIDRTESGTPVKE